MDKFSPSRHERKYPLLHIFSRLRHPARCVGVSTVFLLALVGCGSGGKPPSQVPAPATSPTQDEPAAAPLSDALFALPEENTISETSKDTVVSLEIAPKNFLALPGQTAHFVVRAYNTSGKYVGKVKLDDVKVTSSNAKFALVGRGQGQLKFTTPNETAFTTFTVELKDQPSLRAYGSIETVRLQNGVINISQDQLAFPTLVSRVEDIDEPETFQPFTLTGYAEAMRLAQGTSQYPAIFRGANLKLGQRIGVLGYGGLFGEVTQIVKTQDGAQLVLLKPLGPKAALRTFNAAPIQPGTPWDNLLDGATTRSGSSPPTAQTGDTLQAQAASGGLPCAGALPTFVDFKVEPTFNFSSFNLETQDVTVQASTEYLLNMNLAKGFKVTCEPFPAFHRMINLPGAIGAFAHAEFSGTVSVTLAVEAQYTAVSLVGGVEYEARILPTPGFTQKSFELRPTLFGTDVLNVDGMYGRGKSELEVYPYVSLSISLLNAKVTELLDKIADRFPYLQKGTHLGLEVNAGLSVKGAAEALTMRAAFADKAKPTLGSTASFKAELAPTGPVGEILEQLGLSVRPASFEKELKALGPEPEIPTEVKVKDLSATQSHVDLSWKNGVTPSPVQLGADPKNALHAKLLNAAGGDLTYREEDCKNGPMKAQLVVNGPLTLNGKTMATLPYDTGKEVLVCAKPEVEVDVTVEIKRKMESGPDEPDDCPAPDTMIKYSAVATMMATGKVPEGSGWQIKRMNGKLDGQVISAQVGPGPLRVERELSDGEYTFTGELHAENDGASQTAAKAKTFQVTVPPDEIIKGGPAILDCGPPPGPGPGGGSGQSGGDPHLATFDRHNYSFQGVGEYVLTRSSNRSFEVQTRFKRAGDFASANAAVAMNVVGDRVGVYALGATAGNGGVGLLRVNGQEYPFTMSYKTSLRLPKGGYVNINGMGGSTAFVTVYWPDGSNVVVATHPEVIGFVNVNVAGTYRGHLEGLLGNFDGGRDNDLRGRDGALYPTSLTFQQLYKAYGQSWRLQVGESLFDYAPGQSTDTFIDLDFPREPVVLPPAIQQQAEAVCRQAGVQDTVALQNCAFDVAVTNSGTWDQGTITNPTWAQQAAIADPARPHPIVAPALLHLAVSQSQTLVTTVIGNANPSEIQWSATGGTVTANNDGSATFTAPSTPGEYVVTANLRGERSTARVVVYAQALRIAPDVTVFEGQSTTLAATLLGDYAERPLVWETSGGTITPEGDTSAMFQAPTNAGDYTVTVFIRDEPSVRAQVALHVLAPRIDVSPTAVTAEPGDVIGFNTTIIGSASSQDLDWRASGGQITPGLGAARFVVPDVPGEYIITVALRTRPDVTAQAKVVVPRLEPILRGPWGGQEAVMFPGQRVSLGGEGLRATRAEWTTTGGALSTLAGNGVEYTAPSTPGDYVVTYGLANNALVRTELRVRVIEPRLVLNPASVTADVGQVVRLQVENVPPYYCSLLRLSAGEMSGCTVNYVVPGPGTTTLTVALGDVAGASSNAQITGHLFTLVLPGDQPRVHAGERLRVRAVNLAGNAYSQAIEWSAGGGTMSPLGNGEAEFMAGQQPGEYRIVARATTYLQAPVEAAVKVELEAPVLSFTNGVVSPIIPSGESVTLRATKANGGPYPVPLVWAATGGTVTPQADGTAVFTAGEVPGDYQVTASPQYGPELKGHTELYVVQRITGETRFIVTWGASPSDLDTHLWLPASMPYHVYYGRRGADAVCPYAQLDQDVTSGYGPEVMRVRRLTGSSGLYVLQVYNYSGNGTFTSAEAKVTVIGEDGRIITTVTAPSDNAPGRWWNVLSFDATTGVINVTNTVGGGYEPYYDTDQGCGTMTTNSLSAPSQGQQTQSTRRTVPMTDKPRWVPETSNLKD